MLWQRFYLHSFTTTPIVLAGDILGCLLHCFFIGPLHQTPISWMHAEGWDRIHFCVRNVCNLLSCVCVFALMVGAAVDNCPFWGKKSTDLPPALLCLILLLAQPWACLVTFDMQMIGPYWWQRTQWQVFTEFECKHYTHRRIKKKSFLSYNIFLCLQRQASWSELLGRWI